MTDYEKKNKQISIVLETPVDYDVLNLIGMIEKYLKAFKDVNIKGTHIKVIEKREN